MYTHSNTVQHTDVDFRFLVLIWFVSSPKKVLKLSNKAAVLLHCSHILWSTPQTKPVYNISHILWSTPQTKPVYNIHCVTSHKFELRHIFVLTNTWIPTLEYIWYTLCDTTQCHTVSHSVYHSCVISWHIFILTKTWIPTIEYRGYTLCDIALVP